MIEEKRRNQIKEFNNMKLFESKCFMINNETNVDSPCYIVKLPLGYLVNYYFNGKEQCLFMPDDTAIYVEDY